MRLLVSLILCCVAVTPVSAQVLLERSGTLENRYIVQFAHAQDTASRLAQGKGAAISELRAQQDQRIEQLQQDLRGTDLQILRNLWVKQSVAIYISVEFLSRLRGLPYVTAVRSDRRFKARPQGVVTLPLSGELVQDNLERVQIDSLWADGYRGQGVLVAILDSGVDVLHDDLKDRWRAGTNSWFDPYQEQASPKDLTGHGTGVGSIVLGGNSAGSYLGMAPASQWIAARIFDDTGNSTESAISAALQWVLDPDGNAATDDFPDIVQNSWGLAGTPGFCFNPFAAELAAIDALGIDQVFAVGNEALNGPGPGGFSSYLTPAFDRHVVSVGAIKADDSLLFSSSRGPDICGSEIIPSLVAPGELIRTADLTFNGFDSDATTVNNGTSFSSPHVSGALALLRSKYDATDHLDYRNAIFDSTVDLGTIPGPDPDYGRGKLQSAAAAAVLDRQSTGLRANEVSFSNAVYVFSEADSMARVVVLRSGDVSTTASVDISSVDGSATSAADFQAILTTLNFAAGESQIFVDLQLTDDTTVEASEAFQLELTNNFNINLGARASLSVTIVDDDGVDEESEEDMIGGSALGLFELLLMASLGFRHWGRR